MSDYMAGKWTLVSGRVRERQLQLENTARDWLMLDDRILDESTFDAQARINDFHVFMMGQLWSLYWDLHAEFQSGYTDFGTKHIGYSKKVLEDSHYGEWATRYP